MRAIGLGFGLVTAVMLVGASCESSSGADVAEGTDAGEARDSGEASDAAGGQDAAELPDAASGPPIPGLAVHDDDLRGFFGDRGGILVWVNAGGQLDMLDFRGSDPQIETIESGGDHVNPLISPDGSRVVYSQGSPNGPKFIYVKRLPDGAPQPIGVGDIGFWHVDNAGGEHIVYCDWSDKVENGADGETHQQTLVTGTTDLDGSAAVIHDRAMDGGANADLSWLGQVYNNLWAYDMSAGVEYGTDKFFLMDGSPADHQSCNGSMAPDSSARLMTLVIPHDWVRVYTYNAGQDRFIETSRFTRPAGMVEWEFPEWSTDPDFFTAILMASDYRNRLHVGRVVEGEVVPQLVRISDDNHTATYSHLWLEP